MDSPTRGEWTEAGIQTDIAVSNDQQAMNVHFVFPVETE